MLNEGYVLFKSLERCGIVLTKRHPDLKKPGKKDGLIVGLNREGRVDRIEYRNKDDVSRLWTIREGNYNSFPVLILREPIWKVDKNDELRNNLNNLKEETKKRELIIKKNRKLNITKKQEKWWKRLIERINNIIQYFETQDEEYKAFFELMNRFKSLKINNFIEDLSNNLRQKGDDIPYSLLENILIGNKWDNRNNGYVIEIPLILDVSDWKNFSIRVASPKFEGFVSNCLYKMEKNHLIQQNASEKISALSGKNTILEDDKFPNPKLPVIGITYIFAVNKDTPCQTRYKKTSVEIIPIGREEANSIQDSLIWITDSSREGKTWYPVPGLMDNRDLLITYLENKPDIDVNKAYLLGGISKNSFSESNYEAIAKIVIDALKGKEVVKVNDVIRIFVLRKVDLGRTQVSLHRVYTVSELEKADKLWREASKNSPPFSLPFFKKEIKKITENENIKSVSISQFLNNDGLNTIFLSTWCPFPADLVQITQKQWIRFGKGSYTVPGISLGDIYDIFFDLDNKQKDLANDLLRLTIQRTQSLLIGFGNVDHKKEIKIFNTDTKFAVLKIVSIISIYLYKLGINKENYMKDKFFLVGRFLSLVDTLHFEWCKNVRGGYPEKSENEWRKAIPPQLLGNAHLQIALDNPVSAFDMLSRRINIYQAWTKKESGEKVKLARWALGELGEISDLLSKSNLPSSTTSAERAQILLGYLARPEKKKDSDMEENNNY